MQGSRNSYRRFEASTGPMERPAVQQLRSGSFVQGSGGHMEKSLSSRIKLLICRRESSIDNGILESPLGKSRHGRGSATHHHQHKQNPRTYKESSKKNIEEVLSEPFLTTTTANANLTTQEPHYNQASPITKRLLIAKTATRAASPDSPTKSASHSSSSSSSSSDDDKNDDDDDSTEVIDERLEQAYTEFQKRVLEGSTFKPPDYIFVPDLDNWRVEL